MSRLFFIFFVYTPVPSLVFAFREPILFGCFDAYRSNELVSLQIGLYLNALQCDYSRDYRQNCLFLAILPILPQDVVG